MGEVMGRIGRPSKWNAALEEAVIEAIEDTGSQKAAAEIAGIHRSTIDRREKEDSAFAARIARAREVGYLHRAELAVEAAKSAEDAAKGRLAFDADRWFLSKIDPKRWGDKVQMQHSGSIQSLSDEEVEARLAALSAKAESGDAGGDADTD